MAEPFAASFFSTNANRNLALPGDTVTFGFSNPPQQASNVLVSVLESVTFLDATAAVKDRPIGGFRGRIAGGKFIVESILGAPLPPEPDPVVIRVAADVAPASPHLFAHTPSPERVLSHALRLRVAGQIGSAGSVFEGSTQLQVEYPLAMVVGTVPNPARDPSLAVVGSWSRQWRDHKPLFRHVEQATTVRRTRPIRPSDYDDLIAKTVICAKKATAGVVALAVGHGDGGQSNPDTVAWCNIVPENHPPPTGTNPFLYELDIDEPALRDGAPPQGGSTQSFPVGGNKVKLDALDRLCDALQGTGIRRLILHTCNAGNSTNFMQMFADRLQVPLFAHTAEVEYTGAAGSGQILASYARVAPVSPRDLRHWPIARLSRLFRPGARPRRFGP